MKKILYIFLLFPFFLNAQITVTSSNLPNIGDTVILAEDFGGYFPGLSGANQNWDFSNALGTPEMLLGFIDPLLTPYPNTFPSSNICVQVDSSAYYYLNTSVNGLAAVGFVDAGIVYPWNDMLLPTPLNYLDTINNTQILYEWDTVFSPAVPAIFFGGPTGPYVVDSIKQIYGNTEKYIVDGWGQVQLPNATFDALRVFETSFDFDNTMYKVTDTITGAFQWYQDPASGTYWNESRYTWRTNDSTVHFSLVEIETDSAGNPYGSISYYIGNSFNSVVISPPIVDLNKLVDVSCNGSSDGMILLDITGTAPPFYCTWSGPNGYTNSGQSISNLGPGTYSVVVYDANSNSITETYVVYEPPVLVASINQPLLDLMVIVNGGTPPYSYFWNTADTLASITPSSNGTYSCVVTDKAGCDTTVFINVTNLPTSILENYSERKLLKITNLLGRETKGRNNEVLFYIYDNGIVEKKIVVE